MIPLNFHHLYYFYVVARAGSIAKARDRLLLAQPTISLQLRQLEKSLKISLFTRERRRLRLTDQGRLVLDYAESIFALGDELSDALRDRPGEQRLRIQIGISDQLSKPVGLRLIRSALDDRVPCVPFITCRTHRSLMSELADHQLDLVLTHQDAALDGGSQFISRPLGALDVHFVAAPGLLRTRKPFPQSLAALPLLYPGPMSPLRPALDRFFHERKLFPRIAAEVHDPELLRAMAQDGLGVAALHSLAIAEDLKTGRLRRLNTTSTGIRKEIWLIGRKRHRQNPIAQRLLEHFSLASPLKRRSSPAG